jgi:hypothetical protein
MAALNPAAVHSKTNRVVQKRILPVSLCELDSIEAVEASGFFSIGCVRNEHLAVQLGSNGWAWLARLNKSKDEESKESKGMEIQYLEGDERPI